MARLRLHESPSDSSSAHNTMAARTEHAERRARFGIKLKQSHQLGPRWLDSSMRSIAYSTQKKLNSLPATLMPRLLAPVASDRSSRWSPLTFTGFSQRRVLKQGLGSEGDKRRRVASLSGSELAGAKDQNRGRFCLLLCECYYYFLSRSH